MSLMSEDDVDFYPDLGFSGEADEDLLKKLCRAKAKMHGDLVDINDRNGVNDSTEDEEEVDSTDDKQNRTTVVDESDVLSEDDSMCPHHKDKVLQYFCKEDSVKVCEICLIFGGHKNHEAISLDEQRRFTVLLGKLSSLQSGVQLKLQEVENMKLDLTKNLEAEYLKLKDELGIFLDGIQIGDTRIVSTLLSDHKQNIKNAVNLIHSVNTDDSLPNQGDISTVARLIKESVCLYVTPGSVETQGEHLIVTSPAVEAAIKDQSNDGYVRSSEAFSQDYNEVIEFVDEENVFSLPDSSSAYITKIANNMDNTSSEGSDSGIGPGHIKTVQVYSPPAQLCATAKLCSQYNLLAPDSILLFFDNHITEHRIEVLKNIDKRTNLVSLPGPVLPGHAVLAPCNGWMCRAQVMSRSDTRLQVLYVDHGNIDIVNWSDCFVVPLDLLFAPLATQVSLAGIKPVSGEEWSMQARQRLLDLLLLNNGRVRVKSIKTEELPIETKEVKLFVNVEDNYKDVGQCLVSEGFARSDSFASNHSSRSTCEEVTSVENRDELFSVEMPASGKVIDKNPVDVEVTVICIVSPDEVFVRRVEDSDRWIKFHQELQEVGGEYEISDEKEKIERNQKVLCKVDKYWYRGTVLSVDELCEVRLLDLADVVKVEMHNIRKLEESSNVVKERMFLRKVGLPGIEPAGSGGGWSGSSIELLERIAKNNEIILSSKGDKIDLVVLQVTSSNPFDVESISKYSVAQILLNSGLALKANTRKKCAQLFTD